MQPASLFFPRHSAFAARETLSAEQSRSHHALLAGTRWRRALSSSMVPLLGVIAVICGCAPSLSQAAAPVTATRATMVHDTYWSPHQQGGCDSRTEDKVLVGRAHHGDEDTPPEFLCATLSYKGNRATLSPQPHIYLPENGHTLVAPLNQFLVGQHLNGDENGTSVYWMSMATAAGETLYVKPEGGWTTVKEESNHRFVCPANTLLIARGHEGDENGTTYYACGSLWGQSAPLPSAGQIVFYHYETNVPCSVDVPSAASGTTWTYPFRAHDSRCAWNVIRGLQLDNVPSAVRILLTDDELCQKTDDFWVLLRTTSKSTTVSPELKIADIFTYPKGSIIRPGLLLVDYHLKPGADTTRHLSCVQITTSATPPAP